MYKSTTLLKVIAVLFILGGVMGFISSLTSQMLIEWSESISGIDTGVEITTLDMVISALGSLISLVLGVLALMSKQYKLTWILMIVYVLYIIYGLIDSIQMIGFTPLSMISFITPALFMWGLYTSKVEEEVQTEITD